MLTEPAVHQGEPGALEEADMIKQLNNFSPWVSFLWIEGDMKEHRRQGVMVAAFPAD